MAGVNDLVVADNTLTAMGQGGITVPAEARAPPA